MRPSGLTWLLVGIASSTVAIFALRIGYSWGSQSPVRLQPTSRSAGIRTPFRPANTPVAVTPTFSPASTTPPTWGTPPTVPLPAQSLSPTPRTAPTPAPLAAPGQTAAPPPAGPVPNPDGARVTDEQSVRDMALRAADAEINGASRFLGTRPTNPPLRVEVSWQSANEALALILLYHDQQPSITYRCVRTGAGWQIAQRHSQDPQF